MFRIKTLSSSLLLTAMSIIFLLLFSISTSPLYSEPFISDSGLFQLIGKGWSEGVLPYVGLWDNKGPLLYLINALGFLLTGNKMGVFLFQIINLTCALWIVYRLFCLRLSQKRALTFTLLALFWLSNTMVNNDPGEWLLVPLSLSFYLFFKWLDAYKQRKQSPSDRCAIVYGATIACGLLLRVSDCFSLILALFASALMLLIDGEWKIVVRHSFIASGAFVVVLLPFMLYFYAHQALDEMWYAMFLHNLEYVSQSTFQSYSLYAIISFCLSFLCYIGTFVVSIMVFFLKREYRREACIWLVVSAGMLFFLFNTYASGRYGTSSLPFFVIMLLGLECLMQESSKCVQMMVRKAMSLCLVCAFAFQTWQVWTRDRLSNPYMPIYRIVEKHIPLDERSSFVAFNTLPDIYYYTSLKPCHRFFVTISTYVQNPHDTLRDRIRNEYARGKASWVLVRESGYANYIQDILDKQYQIECLLPYGHILYHKKQ